MTSYDIGEQVRTEESKRIGLEWNRLDWVGLDWVVGEKSGVEGVMSEEVLHRVEEEASRVTRGTAGKRMEKKRKERNRINRVNRIKSRK